MAERSRREKLLLLLFNVPEKKRLRRKPEEAKERSQAAEIKRKA